jgi:hypothetical protein
VDVERMDVATLEEQWEARCGVSHAPHFTSLRNDTLFFHRPTKPPNALRVALATSGGLYVEGMPPFDMISHAGDDSIRWIPRDVVTTQLRFAHDHYDHTDADQDPNCMFPLDRLRELVAAGEVGAIASVHVGLMGIFPIPNASPARPSQAWSPDL